MSGFRSRAIISQRKIRVKADGEGRREGEGMVSAHIFLVGMSGSGKTSLGRKLAANLNLCFVDTDQRISEMLGLSPDEVFSRFGEAFLRNAESGVLIGLIGEAPCIVSTGGGLPTSMENVQLMQNHGIIIHVDRPLDQILADIRPDLRLLKPGTTREGLIDEYNQRIGYYRACADYTLDNAHGFVVGLNNLTELVSGIR